MSGTDNMRGRMIELSAAEIEAVAAAGVLLSDGVILSDGVLVGDRSGVLVGDLHRNGVLIAD